jgi:hypothetical protein
MIFLKRFAGGNMNEEGRKPRRFLVLLLVLLTLAAGLLLPAIHAARAKARESSCIGKLNCCFPKSFIIYGMDHDGQMPPSMTAMGPAGKTCYISQLKIFLCPGSHSLVGSATNIDEWMDYIYIPWAGGATNTPSDYPLMYDRRLSNHGGKGINVVRIGTMNGVEGAFWDENAEQLKAFAAKHPDFHIPLPEDVK